MINLPVNLPPERLIAVYTVHIADHEGPLWIGIAAAAQVWYLTDTRKNRIVRDMIMRDGNPMIVFHMLTTDIKEARICAHKIRYASRGAASAIEETNPVILGRRVRRADGMEYASAREAARANNVNQSNLSKHLNRIDGYRSVGGYYFSWVD